MDIRHVLITTEPQLPHHPTEQCNMERICTRLPEEIIPTSRQGAKLEAAAVLRLEKEKAGTPALPEEQSAGTDGTVSSALPSREPGPVPFISCQKRQDQCSSSVIHLCPCVRRTGHAERHSSFFRLRNNRPGSLLSFLSEGKNPPNKGKFESYNPQVQ